MKAKYRKFIYWGVTALTVIVLAVVFFFSILKFDQVQGVVKQFFDILAPVVYGAVMAYLLAPVYDHVVRWVVHAFRGILPDEAKRRLLGEALGTVSSVILLCAVVFGLIASLIPQLRDSITSIIDSLPSSITNFRNWLEQILSDNPNFEEQVMPYVNSISSNFQSWTQNEAIPSVYNIIGGLSNSVLNVIAVVKNLLIGLIVMIYLLNMKSKFVTQMKMVVYSAFPLWVANKILEEGRYIHSVFGGFIIGKILDSIIIGIMCFVMLSFMNMPYVVLVSVVIGFTNVIPFFGPFIGAIPTSVLILLVSPIKCLYFIVFIFLLQTFDGYILGPRILSASTALSSFWVLFSILLFGGLYGFVGMIIAVPTFAVLYKLATEFVVYRLHKKELSCDIDDYADLDYIETEGKSYIKK